MSRKSAGRAADSSPVHDCIKMRHHALESVRDFARISRLKTPENADSARLSAIFAQANLLHKINA